jgi:tRNA modification GTPase
VFSPDDTIAAIATPMGRGGIGVVRISGPHAERIGSAILECSTPLEPRRATFTRVRRTSDGSPAGAALDEVIVTKFPAPHSYTGQDVLEISAHGSPVVLNGIVCSALAAGARLARPGEFTLRAFLNGKRDLVQAEAVADLIDAATPLQARVAFDQLEGTLTRRIAEIDSALFDLVARLEASIDFPDEGYHFIEPSEIAARIGAIEERIEALLADAARGRMIREGAVVVIAGRPNVGKSSIFNVLVGSDRAIVTEIPGTTRDLVSERTELEGLSITLVDTAGAREANDVVEREGVARGLEARGVADLVVLVLDQTEPHTLDDDRLLAETQSRPRIVVENKIDKPSHAQFTPSACSRISVSAISGRGIDELRRAIVSTLTGSESLRDTASVSNVRHIDLMRKARAHLAGGREAAASRASEEFVVSDLQAARVCFDEIVGARTSEDVLNHVFERFCIGK